MCGDTESIRDEEAGGVFQALNPSHLRLRLLFFVSRCALLIIGGRRLRPMAFPG
jgi:hypothetical protein